MQHQLLKLGEDYKRFLQLRRFYWLSWLRSFGRRRSSLGGSFRFGLDVLDALRRSRASLWRMLVLMMLLLADFFGVRDVSWVSHQLIDGFQGIAGRMSEQTTHKHDGVATALCRRAGRSNTAKSPRYTEAATTFARWLLAFRENF